MEHFLQSWGYAAIFVLALVEAICIPFPSEITFGFAGALAAEGHFEPGRRHRGRPGRRVRRIDDRLHRSAGPAAGPWSTRYGKYLLISSSDLDRATGSSARRGDPAVALGRILPFVRTFVSLVAGIGEMAVVAVRASSR